MKLIKESILPVVGILLLAYLGKYIYIVDGRLDWLRLCLVFGIPFGVPYMMLVIPIGENPATNAFILILNVIIGAAFGYVVAAVALIRAVVFFLWWLVNPGSRQGKAMQEK